MAAFSPELSVLIPTVRRREDLRRAIQSVLENGFDGELEVIVSDDDPAGSAREVVEVLGEERVRYFQNPGPHGKAENWASASRQASGVFCTKLDDDDLLRPGYLAKTVALLREHDRVGSVYTAYEEVNVVKQTRKEVVDQDFFGRSSIVEGPSYVRAVLANEGGYPLNHKTTAVYRRELAERFGHFNRVCEDFAFSTALAVEGDVAYVPEVLFEYRLHGENSVADYPGLSRNSFRALEGLAKLPIIPVEGRMSEAEWQHLVASCRRALPFYFLLAALRTQGLEDAQHLYIDLKMDGRLEQPRLAWLLVHGMGQVPGTWLDAVFRAYQHAPWLQSVARAVFGRDQK